MPKYKIILLIIIILLVALSWTLSSLSRDISSRQSNAIASFFSPLLDFVFGESNYNLPFFDKFIRKAAHVTEYLLISSLLALVFDPVRYGIPLTLLISMCLALFDETIQIFSERGTSVLDVWLDFGGACIGLLIGMFIYYVLMKKRNPHRQQTS